MLNLLPQNEEDFTTATVTALDTLTGGIGTGVNALLVDDANRLWVGTSNGIRAFEADFYRPRLLGKRQVRYGTTSGDSLELPSRTVAALYQDEDGIIWVGTSDGYTRAEITDDNSFSSGKAEVVSMPGVRFNVFHEFGGEFYAGTNQGLYQYENDAFVKDDAYAGAFIRDMVLYQNRLWLATQQGLLALNSGGEAEQYSVDSGHLTRNLITALTVTDDGHLWIGNSDGIDRNEDGTWTSFNPEAGDEYVFRVRKNFTHDDVVRFTAKGATIDTDEAKRELSDIAVVPNPYVVTASWEPQHFFTSGRGERKIDFINLPSQCTIRIFTMRGFLVETIEHNTNSSDGAASWDLTTKDGLDAAYGVYIFHVDAPGVGEHIGKFALIK